ncbi:MAG: hypothetical protein N2595_04540 [bacterium]|nr:hypothetical protein [bacterium]
MFVDGDVKGGWGTKEMIALWVVQWTPGCGRSEAVVSVGIVSY